MSKVDFFGHAFYFFLFLGMLLLQAKDYRGWAFRFAGEIGWIGIGLVMGMSSIVLWGCAFMVVDVLGYFKWQKEQAETEWVENAEKYLDELFSDDFSPDCTEDKHVEGCQNFVPNHDRPMWNVVPSVEEPWYWSGFVANDTPTVTKEKKNVKKNTSAGRKPRRKQRTNRAKAKRNPAPKRQGKGKKVATKRRRPTDSKVRTGGRRSSK